MLPGIASYECGGNGTGGVLRVYSTYCASGIRI